MLFHMPSFAAGIVIPCLMQAQRVEHTSAQSAFSAARRTRSQRCTPGRSERSSRQRHGLADGGSVLDRAGGLYCASGRHQLPVLNTTPIAAWQRNDQSNAST